MLPKVIAACDFARATGEARRHRRTSPTSKRCRRHGRHDHHDRSNGVDYRATPERRRTDDGTRCPLRGRQAAQGHGPPTRARAHPADAVERRGAAVRRRAVGDPGQAGARRVLRGRCATAASRCSRPRRCSPRRWPSPTPRTGSATHVLNERQVGIGGADARAGVDRDAPTRHRSPTSSSAASPRATSSRTSGWCGSPCDPTDDAAAAAAELLVPARPVVLDLRRRDDQPDDQAGPRCRRR